jgi:ribosomal protein S19E (S16A)
MEFSDLCAPWKIVNGAENLVLQALQFEQMGICRKFPGGRSISHYGSNDCFVEG